MNDYKFFITSVIDILKEEAREAKVRADKEKQIDNNCAFYQGYSTAFYRVISLMQMEANAFNLPLTDLSLSDIDPEKELL